MSRISKPRSLPPLPLWTRRRPDIGHVRDFFHRLDAFRRLGHRHRVCLRDQSPAFQGGNDAAAPTAGVKKFVAWQRPPPVNPLPMLLSTANYGTPGRDVGTITPDFTSGTGTTSPDGQCVHTNQHLLHPDPADLENIAGLGQRDQFAVPRDHVTGAGSFRLDEPDHGHHQRRLLPGVGGVGFHSALQQ